MTFGERPGAGTQPDPLLAVTRGEPTPAELAAVLVVLAGLQPRTVRRTDPGRVVPVWSAPARVVRAPDRPGPGAWRASGLPT